MFILAIIIIIIFQIFFGMFWYSNLLFGKNFKKSMTEIKTNAFTKENLKKAYIKAFILSIVKATIIVCIVSIPTNHFMQTIIAILAILLVAASDFEITIWENQKLSLYLINTGQTVISYVISSIIAILII